MVEGFYTATFKTHDNIEGAGVLVMKNGKLVGGDNAYKYVGTYTEKDGRLQVTVKADRFAPGCSVFGDIETLHLTFKCSEHECGLDFSGGLTDAPDKMLEVKLTKQPETI